MWGAPNLNINLAKHYDEFYQPKKRPDYAVKDGKVFDPVTGLYIDLAFLIYKREEPTDKGFRLSAIDIAFAKGDNDGVLSMTENILKKRPADLPAMCDKAIALSRSGRVEEALALNTQALKLSPDNPTFLNNRAVEYYKLGKPEDALRDLEKSMLLRKQKDEKPFLPSYGLMFAIKCSTGDHAGALDALEAGLSTKGDGAIASAQLTFLAKHIGSATPAEALARIKELRSQLGPHVQPAKAPAETSSARSQAPVPVTA